MKEIISANKSTITYVDKHLKYWPKYYEKCSIVIIILIEKKSNKQK